MQTVNLYERKTFRYADGWSNADSWDYLTTLKLTPARLVRESRGYDDGGTWVQYARVPAGADWRQIARAVRQTGGGSTCRHEYDCCGCELRTVFTKLVAPRRLLVRTSIGYNY